MSAFDVENFMNTQVEGANSTKVLPIPECETVCQARDVRLRNPKEDMIVLEIDWEPMDKEVTAKTNRDNPVAKQSLFLDIKDGKLDMREGANAGLGRVRAAVGLNDPNRPFSFSMIKGMTAMCQITHRPDKQTGDIYAEVRKVAHPSAGLGRSKEGSQSASSGAARARAAARG